MKPICLILLLTSLAFGQQVTISQQPTSVEIASLGAPVYKIAIYSAEVCSSPGVAVSGSWGQVSQIAEVAGINVINAALVPAVTQKAANKSTLHKAIEWIGWAGLATVAVAALHTPPPWLVAGGADVAGLAQVIGGQLSTNEAQAAANTNAALAVLADPTAQFSVSNGACIAARILFGQQVANFVPIHAMLPTAPVSTPALRGAPSSQVPGASASIQSEDGAAWEPAGIEYVAFVPVTH